MSYLTGNTLSFKKPLLFLVDSTKAHRIHYRHTLNYNDGILKFVTSYSAFPSLSEKEKLCTNTKPLDHAKHFNNLPSALFLFQVYLI